MYFHGKRVSWRWFYVLHAAESDGVQFHINSGRRTMAEQWALVRQKGVWSPGNPTGAAYPSPNAPHIRVGRQAHALDMGPGKEGLAAWLRRFGARPRFPIAAEPWHMEITERELASVFNQVTVPEDERRWIAEYDRLLKARKNIKRRRVLRAAMKNRRKEIFQAAKKNGWKYRNRRRRYAALLVRSR